ncbi:MAG: DUF4080 domain-containing protein, partial [Bdellovibrionaceae bacterium]|nr:DUF4080 domain-containing protein [Pseudobdellovibrionaceae bacterium]
MCIRDSDRLPDQLKELIKLFPPGVLQFEIGIQTWNPSVAANISRRQNYQKIIENLAWLRKNTHVHTHADLIVGLPGETIESFAYGFDQLNQLGPNEIQVGILKRLKGTPIVRHDREYEVVWNPHPPFNIISNRDMDALTIRRLTAFAKIWDLFANSGHFKNTIQKWKQNCQGSWFFEFLSFVDFFVGVHSQLHGIHLNDQAEALYRWLVEKRGWNPQDTANLIAQDWQRKAGRPALSFMSNPRISAVHTVRADKRKGRQNTHLTAVPS